MTAIRIRTCVLGAGTSLRSAGGSIRATKAGRRNPKAHTQRDATDPRTCNNTRGLRNIAGWDFDAELSHRTGRCCGRLEKLIVARLTRGAQVGLGKRQKVGDEAGGDSCSEGRFCCAAAAAGRCLSGLGWTGLARLRVVGVVERTGTRLGSFHHSGWRFSGRPWQVRLQRGGCVWPRRYLEGWESWLHSGLARLWTRRQPCLDGWMDHVAESLRQA